MREETDYTEEEQRNLNFLMRMALEKVLRKHIELKPYSSFLFCFTDCFSSFRLLDRQIQMEHI